MDAHFPIRHQSAKVVVVVMTTKQREASKIKRLRQLGIDLAKEVFQIHGVDEYGKAVLWKQLKRKNMTNSLRIWNLV